VAELGHYQGEHDAVVNVWAIEPEMTPLCH
jgi:hypothetical protein